jgi:fatty acid desaturase
MNDESPPLTKDSAVQYPVPRVLNALIVSAQLCGFVLALALLPKCVSWWHFALLYLFFAVLMNSLYSSLHEAHHRLLFHPRQLNDAVGILLACLFPAPFHLLRQAHLSHHAHNRTDDEAFDLYFEHESRLYKTVFWYCILLGIYWLWVAAGNLIIAAYPRVLRPTLYKWDRTSQALLEGLNPRFERVIQAEALAIIILHVAIVYIFNLNPLSYFLMYFCFGFLWSAMQYVHHYLTERDILKGARNLRTFSVVDKVWLNHNYHLTHHMFPSVPWFYLPNVQTGQDPHRGSLLPAYLRMWRGPWRGQRQLPNPYAGKPILK